MSIKGCKATIEAHGTSHSDFPHDAIYNGPVTLEVEFRKKGPNSGELKLNIFTPKAKIEVRGEVTTGNPITMSSCP